jgi:hypothetical protein
LDTPMTSCIIHHSLLTSIPAPEKRDGEREREKEEEKGKRKKRELTEIQGVFLLLPSQAMAEQDWTPSKVMQGDLQSLMK